MTDSRVGGRWLQRPEMLSIRDTDRDPLAAVKLFDLLALC